MEDKPARDLGPNNCHATHNHVEVSGFHELGSGRNKSLDSAIFFKEEHTCCFPSLTIVFLNSPNLYLCRWKPKNNGTFLLTIAILDYLNC